MCDRGGKKRKLEHHPSYIEHVQNVWEYRRGREIEGCVCVCAGWFGCGVVVANPCVGVSEYRGWLECIWLLLTSDTCQGGCVTMSLFNMVYVCECVLCLLFFFCFTGSVLREMPLLSKEKRVCVFVSVLGLFCSE